MWSGLAIHVAGATALAANQAAATAPAGFAWNAFLGPFHMVLLHLPIGFVVASAILEAIAWWRSTHRHRTSLHSVLALTAASAWITAGLGLARAATGSYSEDLVEAHERAGFIFAALATVAWWCHRGLTHHPASPRALLAFRLLLAAAAALVGLVGHLGGSLTHGRGFLTDHAPAWISFGPRIEEPRTPVPAGGSSDDATLVQRAFATRCLSCHGPEKQKGRFRVDDRSALLAGGTSGEPGIVPGDPAASHLLRLVLLPSDHDDAMPPDGKPGFSETEILALIRWIRAGAPPAGTP